MRQLNANKKTPNYWIEYTNDETHFFFAENDTEARHYFMMEGDHAHNYGPIDSVRIELAGGIVEADTNEGKAVHRTRSGKGAVGQAIARHKQPPNCS